MIDHFTEAYQEGYNSALEDVVKIISEQFQNFDHDPILGFTEGEWYLQVVLEQTKKLKLVNKTFYELYID